MLTMTATDVYRANMRFEMAFSPRLHEPRENQTSLSTIGSEGLEVVAYIFLDRKTGEVRYERPGSEQKGYKTSQE